MNKNLPDLLYGFRSDSYINACRVSSGIIAGPYLFSSLESPLAASGNARHPLWVLPRDAYHAVVDTCSGYLKQRQQVGALQGERRGCA